MVSAAAETMRCCGGGRIMQDHSSKNVFAKCSSQSPMVVWPHFGTFLEVVSKDPLGSWGSSWPKACSLCAAASDRLLRPLLGPAAI